MKLIKLKDVIDWFAEHQNLDISSYEEVTRPILLKDFNSYRETETIFRIKSKETEYTVNKRTGDVRQDFEEHGRPVNRKIGKIKPK